jgi:hypothetical protein
MFAKSTRIGLVSLFVVAASALGGCAESVGSAPASFPSEHRPVAYLTRQPVIPPVVEDRVPVAKVEVVATRTDAKHGGHPVASRH